MFATETDCVYCAVRIPYLNIRNVISPLKGLAYTEYTQKNGAVSKS